MNEIGKAMIVIISMSKIRKIKVTLKNRIENGIRFKEKGSNPHSNGDNFSFEKLIFFEEITKIEIIKIINKKIKIKFLIKLFLKNFMFGKHTYFIY